MISASSSSAAQVGVGDVAGWKHFVWQSSSNSQRFAGAKPKRRAKRFEGCELSSEDRGNGLGTCTHYLWDPCELPYTSMHLVFWKSALTTGFGLFFVYQTVFLKVPGIFWPIAHSHLWRSSERKEEPAALLQAAIQDRWVWQLTALV